MLASHCDLPLVSFKTAKQYSHLLAFLLCCLLLAVSATSAESPQSKAPPSQSLRLATTTSTENSGLLGLLLPQFTRDTGLSVTTSVVGSGRALQMGREGKVDVILSHSPNAEKRFVQEGYGIERQLVMTNDFVVVGPVKDPSAVGQSNSIQDALRRIAQGDTAFISRGDGSGTHRKEMALWASVPMEPHWRGWYQEFGDGMAATLAYTSRQQAYTLTDRGTWLARFPQLKLTLLYSGDPLLANPYAVIAVNPDKHPKVNHGAALTFINWLISPAVQRLIADFRVNNQPLFTPEHL